jgi:hypothetical protein
MGRLKGEFDVRNDSTIESKKLNQSLGQQMLLANSTHFKEPSLPTQWPVLAHIIDLYARITGLIIQLTKNRVASKH